MASLYTTYPPSLFVEKGLGSVFGMHEMECAAARIIQRCAEVGYWVGRDTRFSYEDFTTHDEQVGFLNLLLNGWLCESFVFNDAFIIHPAFVERLVVKLVEEIPEQYATADISYPEDDGPGD